MRIIILGCGRVGSTLAQYLVQEHHHVTVIDRDQGAFDKAVQRLGANFTSETVRGVGIDEDVLRQAGIEQAHAFISVTSGDNTNLVAAQIAKHRFNVPKVLARVYDPIRAEVFREGGIETICSTLLVAGVFHDLLLERPLKNAADYFLSPSDRGQPRVEG